jgi:hypothetical protein
MQEQFANLSSVLVETNENLHTFEFMLNQYRRLATIRPMLQQGHQVLIKGRRVFDTTYLVVLYK